MIEPIQFITASVINAGLVVVPAYVYAAVKRSKPIAQAASLTLVLFILQAIILSVPNLGFFSMLKMNWLQKLSMFLLTVLTAHLLHYKRADWALKRPELKHTLVLAVLLSLVTTIPALIEIISKHEISKFNPEYFLFELTMPGLHEEPLYRGLLLAIWDRAAGRPCNFIGTKIGIGALVSSLLFVLGHTFTFDHFFHPIIAPLWVWLDMSFFALAMVWFRYKCDSFWPPLLAHNLGNAATHLVEVI